MDNITSGYHSMEVCFKVSGHLFCDKCSSLISPKSIFSRLQRYSQVIENSKSSLHCKSIDAVSAQRWLARELNLRYYVVIKYSIKAIDDTKECAVPLKFAQYVFRDLT